MDVTPANRTGYAAYLQSSEWRIRRNHALRDAKYTCQRCGAKRDLQVHHRTYERLGHEWDQELEVLCFECHRGHHLEEMASAPATNLYLKLASEALREQPFGLISELADAVKIACAKLKIRFDPFPAHRALAMLSGSSRLSSPPPQTREEVLVVQGRPLTDAESRETLKRLGFSALVKTMPSAAKSPIDIYGPPPRHEVEHDYY